MSRIVAKKYDDVIGCSKVLSEGIEQGKILFLYVLFSFFESTLLNVFILTNDNINFCCNTLRKTEKKALKMKRFKNSNFCLVQLPIQLPILPSSPSPPAPRISSYLRGPLLLGLWCARKKIFSMLTSKKKNTPVEIGLKLIS